MKLSQEIPAGGEGYWYLGSPFTNYPNGHEQAWLDISRIRGELLLRGIHGYSPICESWGAVQLLSLPVDHTFWRGDNLSKMRPALGIIVCKLESWDHSEGLKREIVSFKEMGKPIIWLEP